MRAVKIVIVWGVRIVTLVIAGTVGEPRHPWIQGKLVPVLYSEFRALDRVLY